MNEIRIVLEESDGTPITRVDDSPSWQGKYRVGVRYVLEDGRTITTGERFRLRRDAKEYADALPCAPRYPRSATFDDGGEFFGTRTTYSLRGSVA
jgi:hypothetical protein